MAARFSYNGVSLEEPLETLLYERTPIFNGPDYLYTKHVIHVRGVYAREPDKAALAHSPPDQDKAIRQKLSEPRGQLEWRMHGEGRGRPALEILRSPAPGRTVDAANGPMPLALNVIKIHGLHTWIIEYAVSTCVDERGLHTKKPSVMLSHRWRMESVFDEHYLEARIIRGRAIFRTDRLEELAATPDDFRSYLWHPVPKGFQIDAPACSVVATEDGTEVEYVLVFRQRWKNLLRKNITHIEARHTRGVVGPGLEDIAFNAVGTGLNYLSSSIGRMRSVHGMVGDIGIDDLYESNPIKLAEMAYGVVQGMVDQARDLHATIGEIRRNVPRVVDRLNVSIWGNPLATGQELVSAALDVLVKRMGLLGLAGIMCGSNVNLTVTQNLMLPYVELHGDFLAGAATSAAPIPLMLVGAVPNLGFPRTDDIETITTSARIDNPTLPGGGGKRGTLAAKLVAQHLHSVYAPPPKPSIPPAAKDLSPP